MLSHTTIGPHNIHPAIDTVNFGIHVVGTIGHSRAIPSDKCSPTGVATSDHHNTGSVCSSVSLDRPPPPGTRAPTPNIPSNNLPSASTSATPDPYPLLDVELLSIKSSPFGWNREVDENSLTRRKDISRLNYTMVPPCAARHCDCSWNETQNSLELISSRLKKEIKFIGTQGEIFVEEELPHFDREELLVSEIQPTDREFVQPPVEDFTVAVPACFFQRSFSPYRLLLPEDLFRAIVPFSAAAAVIFDEMILDDDAVVADAPANDSLDHSAVAAPVSSVVPEAVVAVAPASSIVSQVSDAVVASAPANKIYPASSVEAVISEVISDLAAPMSVAPEAISFPAVLDTSSTLTAASVPVSGIASKKDFYDPYDHVQSSSSDEFATSSDDSSATIAKKRKARNKALKRVPTERATDHDTPYYILHNCEITEPWMQYSKNQLKTMKQKKKYFKGPSKSILLPPPPSSPGAGGSANPVSKPPTSSFQGKTYQSRRGQRGSQPRGYQQRGSSRGNQSRGQARHQPYQRGGKTIASASGPFPFKLNDGVRQKPPPSDQSNKYEPPVPYDDPVNNPTAWKARMTELAALDLIKKNKERGLDTSNISTMSEQRRQELDKYNSSKFFEFDRYMELHPAAVPPSGKSITSLGTSEDYRSRKDIANPQREIKFKKSFEEEPKKK
ncbi:hypothetical protein KSP39_PZI005189 [Platanthera zijinensis]|uniref:Uncharacterized protein n=1 Tax=Platanthera zijinensis TaxID=2320716 RepID=A0AAP0BUT6_9ASPA